MRLTTFSNEYILHGIIGVKIRPIEGHGAIEQFIEDKIRTPSLPIIKLARRPNSAGVIDGPRWADEPDPDDLRSLVAFFDASGALISGTLAAAGSYIQYSIIDIKFNELPRKCTAIETDSINCNTNTLTILFRWFYRINSQLFLCFFFQSLTNIDFWSAVYF